MAGSAGRAWRKAERLFDEAVQAEEAVKQVKTALVWFDADGHLLSRGEAQQQLDKASEKLSGSQWSKVRRLLKDERTLSHLDRLEKQLAEVVAEPQLRESLTRLWVFSKRLKHAKDEEVGRLGALVAMEHVLCGRLCPQWQEAYMQVDELLEASGSGQQCGRRGQQCGADASRSASSCEPGDARSQAAVLELSGLSRGQA